MHLDLPQHPGDFGVGHGHEHHVVDSEKRHQHQRGLEQLPERRNTRGGELGPASQPGAAGVGERPSEGLVLELLLLPWFVQAIAHHPARGRDQARFEP